MIELLRKRRSIRDYLARPIEAKKIAILKEAVLCSPSSRNQQSRQFIFIDDPAVVAQLARAKEHGSEFLLGAPLVVVVLGDESVSDVWVEDCSIAAILLQMTALSLGLGSCWVQIRLRSHWKKIAAEKWVSIVLDIPAHLRVECIIGIGYPTEEKTAVERTDLPWGKIHHDFFGNTGAGRDCQ
jgi:nitroreductase